MSLDGDLVSRPTSGGMVAVRGEVLHWAEGERRGYLKAAAWSAEAESAMLSAFALGWPLRMFVDPEGFGFEATDDHAGRVLALMSRVTVQARGLGLSARWSFCPPAQHMVDLHLARLDREVSR